MRRFQSLLGRFRSDERGAFLAIFGILAIVLIAVSGAVVDYTSVEQARTRAQVALDAAALALQPAIYTDTTTQIKTKAQALLVNRIGDSRISATVTSVATNTTNGELTLKARMNVPLYFVALIGINNMDVEIKSQSTRKKLALEVVMVLDNSGSMSSSSRLTNLKTAANNAVDIIFGGVTTSTTVSIGIVPFNDLVNVGSSYATASWMDKTGISSISNDNFDTDDDDSKSTVGAVNRFALYNQISGVTWAGCVEARPSPYDTNDTTPTTSTPDTLFVPEFAPDEPDGWNNSYLSDTPAACNYTGSCTYKWTGLSCYKDGTTCSSGSSYSSTLTGLKTGSLSCTCPTSGTPAVSATGGSGNNSNWTVTKTWTCSVSYAAQGLTDREKQERLCKYTGTASFSSGKGPNYDCPSASILPLTSTAATVKSRINAMVAAGNTNIAQGTVWGFHVLSPTEPFTEGKAYDTGGLSKAMIVMTDGDNTTGFTSYSSNMNGSTQPSAYMYRWNNRLPGTSDAAQVTEMNTRTLAACTNAKAKGITIYTIGLAATVTASINMLKACASDTGKAYFPAKASDLNSVFTEIANQLSQLRLSE